MMKTSGLYIDFPFCIARCAFCAFNVYGYQEGRAAAYEDALCKEIALHAQGGAFCDREFISIYMGGGTPTRHEARILQKIVKTCRRHFNIRIDAEVTVEAHPATLYERSLRRCERAASTGSQWESNLFRTNSC